MEGFKFRFRIQFNRLPDYVSSKEYGSRRECIDECLSLIKWLKQRDEFAEEYKCWNYHSYLKGDRE